MLEKDTLRLFNRKLAEELRRMNVEQLWDFLQSNEARVKQFYETKNFPKTGVLYAYPHSPARYREHFLSETEEEFGAVIYTLILDFCLGDEAVAPDYWGRSGFLDSPDSCRVKTSDDIMPFVEEDSQVCYETIYFHLLDICHLENIIRAIENKPQETTDEIKDETPADAADRLARIIKMKEFCAGNEDYNAIYIYSYY